MSGVAQLDENTVAAEVMQIQLNRYNGTLNPSGNFRQHGGGTYDVSHVTLHGKVENDQWTVRKTNATGEIVFIATNTPTEENHLYYPGPLTDSDEVWSAFARVVLACYAMGLPISTWPGGSKHYPRS